MFSPEIYIERRKVLKKSVKSGAIIFPANNIPAMNYPSNNYPFRQDSSFLYYFGIDEPGLMGLIDVDLDQDVLFGDNREIDDVVWMGPADTIQNTAKKVGVEFTFPLSELETRIINYKHAGKEIHYLPPYRCEISGQLSDLLKIDIKEINENASLTLIKSVISQRVIKSQEEIEEIEKALDISHEMYTTAMKMAKPGLTEREIFGKLSGISLARGNGISFPMILSVHGETLHNHHHDNTLEDGQLLLIDSGAESPLHYASDITRTIPVKGKFTKKQKEIYKIVLDAQLAAIKMMKPGAMFKDCHLKAAEVIGLGLKKLGLMQGNIKEAVKKGAHALFFPHGLGHHIGLDVHDMEGLGEDYVGYDSKIKRSNQFGLAYLRMAKALQPGYVITVEPGIYFIPQLIEEWKNSKKFKNYINYDNVEKYIDFGGIRIEDDVLVTEKGHKVLGKPIPKTIAEIEKACN
ncbi:MAG: aminopeptidase P family protein [Melioribacteraceae bacterium]|nr:aminopeptidase P family protein [Melioribacteraceae bacterium]MCF8262934.1 aminopeptidase P family protein [Melioribacteraceae bacterium]